MTDKPPKIVVEKNEGFRTIEYSGVFGGPRPGIFEWIVYTDEMVAEDALDTIPPDPKKVYIKRILQCRFILPPDRAKNLAKFLNDQIKKYETTFGKISIAKKEEKKPPPPAYG